MKRILLIVVCCLCLCGCNNDTQKDFQVYNLKIEPIDDSSSKISFTIENNSEYTCNNLLFINLEFKNNNSTINETITPYIEKPINPNDIINSYDVLLKNYKDYYVNVKDVYCLDKSDF